MRHSISVYDRSIPFAAPVNKLHDLPIKLPKFKNNDAHKSFFLLNRQESKFSSSNSVGRSTESCYLFKKT